VISAGVAGANDSTAGLTNYGLVLTKNTDVEMRSEKLYISDKQVRVDYQFLNTSAKDVTVTVAFPMPDITVQGLDDNISVPNPDSPNILGFSTLVDGKAVNAQVEQKVIQGGVDRTALLRSLGVPLSPFAQSTDAVLDKLPKATKDQLVKLGLAMSYDDGEGATLQTHMQATWTLKTTYYWTQTFPAGRALAVHHQYTPSVGGSAGTTWGSTDDAKSSDYAARVAKYCVDNDFLKSVRATVPAGVGYSPLQEERIDYVLISGANWKSPIGDFTMIIDKGAANRLVSFCGDGVTKIAPTQFQVHHTNFTPTKNVAVLILVPPSMG
jgi:Domain of unknown function (DUF4424)